VQGDVASFLNNLVGFLLFRRTQLLSGVVSAAKHQSGVALVTRFFQSSAKTTLKSFHPTVWDLLIDEALGLGYALLLFQMLEESERD
jgi:hypothetical protein